MQINKIHVAARGGVSLSVNLLGPEEGPPVILLHGFGQHGSSWKAIAQVLASEGWRVVIPDLRGHGQSGHAEKGYDLEDFVDDLQRIIKLHDLPPVLVGASMGGLISLFYAGNPHHLPVKKLVLVDIAPKWEDEGVKRILTFMRETSKGFDTIEDAGKAIAAYLPHRKPSQSGTLKDYLFQDEHGRWLWHWDPNLLDWVENISSELIRERALKAAEICVTPTMLLTGENSDVVANDGIDELMAVLEKGHHCEVTKAGHMVVGDAQDDFAKNILNFLGSV